MTPLARNGDPAITAVRPAPPTARRAAPEVPTRRRPSRAAALLAAALLAAAAFAGTAPLLSPTRPPEDIAGASLEQAQQDLAVVAAAPHPMGSDEQSAVEAFLVGELTAMGLQPEVDEQTVTMAPDAPSSVWTGRVRNIVARLEGTGPAAEQAVLLTAHYDSVPASPGAGDNGAGVVGVLAAMRALTSGPPPRHDVIVAFVDGEEHEMLGALALVETAPWMGEVQVAVNTEGVGNAGRVTPALTAPDNGWALRQYLDAVPSPVVYTAFGAPLDATGQGADLGRYQEIVPAGLELVVVGGLPAYHAGTDTAAGMHDGTLAEYVATVVALARRLSAADLDAVQSPDLVAFTVVPGLTVAYSSTWSLPLALAALLAVVAAIGLASRRRRVSVARVVLSWLALALAGLVGVLTATALWLLARVVDPRLSDTLNGAVYDRTAYVLAAVTAGAAGMLLVLWPLRRRCGALEVVAGALLGWSLFALLLAAVLPAAAYAATWPVLAATAGFGVLATGHRSPGVTRATVTLAALPAVLLLSPLTALYFMLAARFELMLPLATPLPMLWVVLALAVVLPLLLVARPRLGWRPAVAAGALAVALAAVGVATSALSSGPRPDLLVYHADADAGTARWVALPPEPDAYTGQVIHSGWTSTEFEASPFHEAGATEPAATVPAGRVPSGLRPPEVTVLSDVTTPDGREIAVEVTPPTGGYALTVDARCPRGVHGIAVNGEDVPQAVRGAPATVRVVAFSTDGSIPVTMTVPAGADVDLALTSYTLGLERSPAEDLQPRPAELTTGVHEIADSVVVTSVTRLPENAGG